jgi:HEPN domain-containing protein
VFDTGYYFLVGFMCHQALEHLCYCVHLAVCSKKPLSTHSSWLLVSSMKKENSSFVLKDGLERFFTQLEDMYSISRYTPEFVMNESEASAILNQTKEVWGWLLTLKR